MPMEGIKCHTELMPFVKMTDNSIGLPINLKLIRV